MAASPPSLSTNGGAIITASPPAYASIAGARPPPPPLSRETNDIDALPHYTSPPADTVFRRTSTLLLPLFLLPLTLLLLFTLSPSSDMSSFISFLKSILLPALLALTLYLLLYYLLLPLYRAHRARYAQYLPVSVGSLTSSRTTTPLRLPTNILSSLLPSRWLRRSRQNDMIAHANDSEEELGEDLGFEVDELGEEERRRRRDGLSLSMEARRMRMANAGRGNGDSGRRLSRELEEGFADDSSGDEDERGDAEDGGERGRR